MTVAVSDAETVTPPPPPISIEQQLVDIDVQLVQQHKFLEALTQLMVLAHQHICEPRIWLLIGFVYTRMAHWKHAIDALETVLSLDPQDSQAKQLLSLALFSTGQQERACKLIDQVVKKKDANSAQWMLRAFLHAHTNKDPMHALGVARDWGKRFADPLTRAAKPLVVQNRDPRKKLKVGYVTADFREHSVAFFMQPVLAHHNPENVEVHVYSSGPADGVTAQLRPLVPHWHDVVALSDEELHAQIRRDGIDILVDLSGFTHGQRLLVFARRAAPVQVTWLGYMHTLGMKAMDYRLVDLGIAPRSHAPHYSETLFYLHAMASYAPPSYAPLCEEPPMVRNGYPTLISLNNSAKVTDGMLRLWARILHAREDARLIIMVKEENADAAQAHMQPRVEAAGMPLERVSVLHQQPLDRFMEMGHIADIALDTSPISGGTTTLHALWMGLPVVALNAERAVDASTVRMLNGLGKGHWVAHSQEDYVERAIAFMEIPQELQVLRTKLRERLCKSVLMDYVTRTTGLEQAFRFMWFNYLYGDKKILGVDTDLEHTLIDINYSQA